MAEGTRSAVKKTPQLNKHLQISLKRMGKTIQCLFIGKCALYVPILVPYDAPRYIGNEIASDSLNTRLENISHSLSQSFNKSTSTSEVYTLPNGCYIHTYQSTINCSSATITMTKGFFTFTQQIEALPPTSSVDLTPFLYSNADLIQLGGCNSPAAQAAVTAMIPGDSKYSWDGEPAVPWCWNEETRCVRLYHSLKEASSFTETDIIPAFQWKPKTYEEKIGSIFPVKGLRFSPFHGMTDFLLLCNKVGVLSVREPSFCCCIEIVISKSPTSSIYIGNQMKFWPEKLGELLASMHAFGSLQYINSTISHDIPEKFPERVSITSFGMLIIRGIGCLLLQLTVDETGSNVKLLHEGGTLSIGPALERLTLLLK